MAKKLALALALLAGALACSKVHLSGYEEPAREPAAAPAADYGVAPPAPDGRPRPEDYLPRELPQNARFYSDLGPDAVDISEYPTQQKYNYAVYAAACSRCHSLARSINAPAVSRAYWEFYMLSMRGRGWVKKAPAISREDRKAIMDFLDFDSQLRKVAREKQFEELTNELKNRMRRLQEKSQSEP